MAYLFYGWQDAFAEPREEKYARVYDPRVLYDMLSELWCAETCAPRMRANWTKENPTFGQCSITAFLAQDIFGGRVYGILREGGNYHCFNVTEDCVFDLTSEQFGDEKLDYRACTEQFREIHFEKEEKKARYEALKAALEKKLAEMAKGEEEAK